MFFLFDFRPFGSVGAWRVEQGSRRLRRDATPERARDAGVITRAQFSHFSSKCFFSLTLAHSSASGGPSFFSMIGFQILASSALSAVYSFWSSGTSSSANIASTGHSATHSVQSMHSSGSITRKFGPSRKQSTGQTSTQSVYLHLIQFSVTTKVIAASSYAAQNSSFYQI